MTEKIKKSAWQVETEERLTELERNEFFNASEVNLTHEEMNDKLDFLKALALNNQKKMNDILRLLDPQNPNHQKIELLPPSTSAQCPPDSPG